MTADERNRYVKERRQSHIPWGDPAIGHQLLEDMAAKWHWLRAAPDGQAPADTVRVPGCLPMVGSPLLCTPGSFPQPSASYSSVTTSSQGHSVPGPLLRAPHTG